MVGHAAFGCTPRVPPGKFGWTAVSGRFRPRPKGLARLLSFWRQAAGLGAPQRPQGHKAYDELIATAGFPKKPSSSPTLSRAAVELAVILWASRKQGARGTA
jgi:hypothetical protein